LSECGWIYQDCTRYTCTGLGPGGLTDALLHFDCLVGEYEQRRRYWRKNRSRPSIIASPGAVSALGGRSGPLSVCPGLRRLPVQASQAKRELARSNPAPMAKRLY